MWYLPKEKESFQGQPLEKSEVVLEGRAQGVELANSEPSGVIARRHGIGKETWRCLLTGKYRLLVFTLDYHYGGCGNGCKA